MFSSVGDTLSKRGFCVRYIHTAHDLESTREIEREEAACEQEDIAYLMG